MSKRSISLLETFRRSKALDNPVFQKNPFVSIPSNDSLDEVFEENNNNNDNDDEDDDDEDDDDDDEV
mgnify:CR=1 FL=1